MAGMVRELVGGECVEHRNARERRRRSAGGGCWGSGAAEAEQRSKLCSSSSSGVNVFVIERTVRVFICGESSGRTEVEVKPLGLSKNKARWGKNTYVQEVDLGQW
ncbi:uncharacterized protein MONOS_959 [Monocercomonoides exilis]|uniref:uncharacterized protein n=1 Tax=Monocercomonoides exilis TaxID=2049356 RepID=UPI00355AC81E|nr:hypothetical protein MONOS_959 [Monocercomonoides exilis]|eukprot:MONOS_959.1-p1 / transcript=MONOS_959.1 / gene=MONOS_959 / organism=Monocercomonoides_exilis_PA203 / gene_product=unspecified product / transcript_product=unspecified product / location=Mono_scaffold00016:56033-56347(+) / protein_length=105 / sequence_SO=supercontig / SO=protein_coding / is_pseudo=false